MKVIYLPKIKFLDKSYQTFTKNKIYDIYLKNEYLGIKYYYIKDDLQYERLFLNVMDDFEILNKLRKRKLDKLNSL